MCLVKCNQVLSPNPVPAAYLCTLQVIFLCYSLPVYQVGIIHVFYGLIM